MKTLTMLLCVVILSASAFAGEENGTPEAGVLPPEVMAQVKELNVQARYFTAIGFHKQSKAKRDEIAAIYDEYGIPVPDEYKK